MRFADDIDLLGGSEELQQLAKRLEQPDAGYGTEISSDKSQILVNSINGTSIEEVKIRLEQADSATTRLAILGKTPTPIGFSTKIKLYKSLVLSIQTAQWM